MKKIVIKMGIDVSTNSTGIATFINNQLFNYARVQSVDPKGKFSGEKVMKDAQHIKRIAIGVVQQIKKTLLPEDYDPEKDMYDISFIIALEQSNHGLKGVAIKLATYAGMWAFGITNQISLILPFAKQEVKMVNPREWQLRIFNQVLESKEGKQLSIKKAMEYFKDKTIQINDDIADAINIASVADVIRDNVFVGQERLTRKYKQVKNTKRIYTINNEIAKIKQVLVEKKNKKWLAVKNAKNSKFDDQEVMKAPLIEFANIAQKERIKRYEIELKELGEDNKHIREFSIIGKNVSTS